MTDWVAALLAGSRRALARVLTFIENDHTNAPALMAALYPHTGRAWVVGVTGAPGTGKSSLVNVLIKAYRAQGRSVGVIAVDPSSPFTGGAILGDRVRMEEHSADSGVFIRSMAARGNLGGLARASRDAIRVLDAAGFDIILVETVGAGQNEVDIVRAAQTILVVEAPGMGDDVQAIKAGILEIADILVVNKADRPGAAQTVRGLRAMLELGHPSAKEGLMAHHGRLGPAPVLPATATHEAMWLPPVVQTVTLEQTGIAELVAQIEAHRAFLSETHTINMIQERAIELELYERLQTALLERMIRATPPAQVQDLVRRVRQREIDPQSAVVLLLTQHDG
ncbi:methylmalonyl Co-A mutase-associated GTPase MeaB [bacterium]|nr:methylmalonyl Co-A mutase-associated GTPase MeaB [bacterium]